ncbi:carbohydrate ABC transporter permease [Paenibacillus sp. J2TS4]|uniref:carbohydrate ABC transporter permease n=1 Tax=Paenibacillus sp. J2TS4 TaxID=2807194 RepID=UPI001AFEF5D8|nr:sugar ABC transporter permease [Paenibacillus sp. J2TS4]GIP31555.1 sugar ABC transporter permease [Paenibacillus sp. J2TS4]
MKTSKAIYLFLLPGMLLYLIFFVYPTLSGLYYSFTDWDGLSPEYSFVGIDNYTNMISNDLVFTKALGNNLKFMFSVVIVQTALSLLLAVLLVKNSKGSVFLRALYFFPTIIASISVAFIWSFMYDPNMGLINRTLSAIGLDALAMNWIGNMDIAIYSIAFVQVWAHTGQMMVVFIAGLQAIPEDLYEVARIEGATRLQTFKRITWPLIAPSATIVVAYTTIQSFKAFDLIFAMTGGGPAYSTEILSTFLYHTAFQNYKFGYASAGSVIFMFIIALITLLQFRILRGSKVSY